MHANPRLRNDQRNILLAVIGFFPGGSPAQSAPVLVFITGRQNKEKPFTSWCRLLAGWTKQESSIQGTELSRRIGLSLPLASSMPGPPARTNTAPQDTRQTRIKRNACHKAILARENSVGQEAFGQYSS